MRRRVMSTCLVAMLLLVLFSPIGVRAEARDQEILNDWCLQVINAPEQLTWGDHPVRIAVVDSGWRANAEWSLLAKLAVGYNYVFHNTLVLDQIGHGSQTIGIIAGGKSVAGELVGLGSQATIIPLVWISKYPSRVLASGGVPALSAAIRDAVDVYDCQVINVSSGICSDEPELRAAVAYAEEQGATVVSAVGNSNLSAPERVYYPAAYRTVIGVGAVNADAQAAGFSQRNSSVMVAAPGERVPAPGSFPATGLATVSGTSFATAYVSSFVALLLSHYPELSPEEVRQVLQQSAQDLGEPGYDTVYGHGVIDVTRGLSAGEELQRKIQR